MVDIWARFSDFGALCVGFVMLFGGFGVRFGAFGWPLGAQRLDQGPLQAVSWRGRRETSSVLEP